MQNEDLKHRKEDRIQRRIRIRIWLQTIATLLGYAGAILAAYIFIFSPLFRNSALALALTFFIVQSLVIAFLLSVLFARKLMNQAKERRRRRIFPLIRALLARRVMGDDVFHNLKRFQQKYPDEFSSCLIQFFPSLRGAGSQRLLEMAVDLKLVEQWQRQLKRRRGKRYRRAILYLARVTSSATNVQLLEALGDDEMEIRLEACRALIHSGEPELIAHVFRFMLDEPLIVRAALAVELRPHALELAQRVVPQTLRSGNDASVICALELIAAWQRALPIPGIAELLRHPNPQARAAALRAAPFLVGHSEIKAEIRDAMTHPDSRVKMAAAWAAGQLKLEKALPDLTAGLHDPDASVANAFAQALGELGDDGMEVLEREILSPKTTSATAALEVLERIRIGRHQFAR